MTVYACHAWITTKSDEKTLGIFEGEDIEENLWSVDKQERQI